MEFSVRGTPVEITAGTVIFALVGLALVGYGGYEYVQQSAAIDDAVEIEGEPFDDIMAALDDLPDDESLLLINSFEPEPLYNVLEQRGFDFETETPESDVWHVEISHT